MLDTLSDRARGDRTNLRRAGALALFLRSPERFDILSRRVPALVAGEGEREAAAEVSRRLGDLNATIGDFRAGLELMKLAEAASAFRRSWGPIACRDAALALTNFRAALKAIDVALKGAKSLRRARARLRPVERRFAADFPTVRARKAAPSGAANGATHPRRHDHMSDAVIVAEVAHDGRSVRHRGDGRELRFDLSEHSLWRLVALRDEVFAAFGEKGTL